MARVTIVIKDTKAGLNVKANFKPDLVKGMKPTFAQAYALALMEEGRKYSEQQPENKVVTPEGKAWRNENAQG